MLGNAFAKSSWEEHLEKSCFYFLNDFIPLYGLCRIPLCEPLPAYLPSLISSMDSEKGQLVEEAFRSFLSLLMSMILSQHFLLVGNTLSGMSIDSQSQPALQTFDRTFVFHFPFVSIWGHNNYNYKLLHL